MYVIMCLNSFFIRETLYTQVHPAFSFTGINTHLSPPSGKFGTLRELAGLDQACLLNEANSLLCGAISYIETSLFSQSQGQYSFQKSQMHLMLTKIKIFQGFLPRIELLQILASTMLSISHTAKTYCYIWKTLYNIIIVKFNLIELVFQTS